MGIHSIPFAIIFTKADKLKPKAIERHVEEYLQEMLKTWEETPSYFITSSSSAVGRDELLQFIDDTNKEINALKNL
jgi:GTP-binding protein